MREGTAKPTGSTRASSQPRTLSRLILTGFMGAGKSTVGRALAQLLDWEFLDLDRCIEANCGQTVAEIFRQFGEAHFRIREREAIQQLTGHTRIVLALGGGSVEDQSTLSSLLHAPETCLVFLDAPLSELLKRLDLNDRSRPLLTNPVDLEERHNRRLQNYRSAHLTIETTGLSPEEVAMRMVERLSHEGYRMKG